MYSNVLLSIAYDASACWPSPRPEIWHCSRSLKVLQELLVAAEPMMPPSLTRPCHVWAVLEADICTHGEEGGLWSAGVVRQVISAYRAHISPDSDGVGLSYVVQKERHVKTIGRPQRICTESPCISNT